MKKDGKVFRGFSAVLACLVLVCPWMETGCKEESSSQVPIEAGLPDGGWDAAPIMDSLPLDSTVNEPCIEDLCVDPQDGDDGSGDGSPSNPFRTITAALAAASDGESIGVLPGTCDTSNGEQFPLVLKTGSEVVSVLHAGQSVVVSGGSPTFLCADGAVVQGFEIRPAGSAFGCAGSGSMSIVRNNILLATLPGVSVEADGAQVEIMSNWFPSDRPSSTAVRAWDVSAQIVLDRNVYSGSMGTVLSLSGQVAALLSGEYMSDATIGIEIAGSASVELRSSTISSCQTGILIVEGSTGDVDLGTSMDPGQNEITGNSQADLCLRADITVQAVGNVWDHTPPEEQTACTLAADIGIESSGTVVTE